MAASVIWMPKVNSIFVIHFLPGEYFWNIVFKFQVKNERASETTFTKIFNVGMLQMFLNYQKSIEIWMNIWGTFKNSPRRWVNCLLFKNPQLLLLSLLLFFFFNFQFAPEVGPTISLPNIIREGCQDDAYDMVNKNNTSEEKECVENPKILSLISSLTSLMCILHRLADGERWLTRKTN